MLLHKHYMTSITRPSQLQQGNSCLVCRTTQALSCIINTTWRCKKEMAKARNNAIAA